MNPARIEGTEDEMTNEHNGREHLKRPPRIGETHRVAEAQALTVRAELRAAMALDGLTLERIAAEARVKLPELEAFLGGSAMTPRWQAKLEAWLARRG